MRTHPITSARSTIERYYDQTWKDYRFLWLNKRNLAFHFGYHDDTTRGHADALLNTNRILAMRSAIAPGERVLDAGCGVGGSSLWLARHHGVKAVGVTLVGSQVTQAQRLASGQGLVGQALFVQADYTRTPFADATFDVVWALESLCHAADKPAFYRDAARLLRPGGRLVVAEYMRAARPLPGTGEAFLHSWLSGWAIPDLDTPEEHGAHARAAGLVDVAVEDFTARARPSLRRLYRIARASYPFATLACWLRIRSTTQQGNVVAALRQYQALERRYWLYGIVSARKE